ERIFRACVLAFSDNEVCMYGRDDGAPASLPFHSHLVDHFARADFARRRILEKTTCGARAVRLGCKTTALRFVHSRLDEIWVIRFQAQSSSQQQFTLSKRSVTIVPLNGVTRNFNNLSFASDAHLFSHRPDLMIVS